MTERKNNNPEPCCVDLSTKVGRLSLKNPVLAASGTFGYGLEFESFVDLNLLGGFVTKGLSLKPRQGNHPPRIHETSCGMLNAIGLHNVGVEMFLKEKLPRLLSYDTAIIVNIYGETPDDFVSVAKELGHIKEISALEINVSCPNVSQGGLDIGTDPIQVSKLVERVRAVCDQPLWTKLTPNITDIKTIAKAAIDGGAETITLINSVRGMAIDLDRRTPCLSTVVGGLSGPAIKPIALAKVYEVAGAFSIPIVGVGGIATGQDALEFMIVGASAIQVGTQNFVQTDATIKILAQMKEYLQAKGIQKVTHMIRSLTAFESSQI